MVGDRLPVENRQGCYATTAAGCFACPTAALMHSIRPAIGSDLGMNVFPPLL